MTRFLDYLFSPFAWYRALGGDWDCVWMPDESGAWGQGEHVWRRKGSRR